MTEKNPTMPVPGEHPAGTARIVFLSIVFSVLMVVSIQEVIALWPTVITKTVAQDNEQLTITQWKESPAHSGISGVWIGWVATAEQRAVWLIIFAGVIGSCIHVLTSMATFVGNRRFLRSWTLWYLVRPLIGAGVAFLIVSVIWGGISTPTQGFNGSNPYQLVAIAGLAGMFSRIASDKLEEIFEQLLRSTKNEQRGDNVTNGTTDITDNKDV
ncbi:MAG: hypothetical protein FGM33_08850 [Candidatus Kapabacteria bacterium]|nr:hypothetical protein [Candidatus Kapabacteria bacterium]